LASHAEKILARNHDKLSTYGIGKEHSPAKWAEIARQLVRKGWFSVDGGNYPVVSVTAEGSAVLRERRSVSFTRLMAVEKSTTRRTGDIECDTELFEALRALRKQVADAAGVPPYVVFSDVSLRHMAREYPGDNASFLRIPGVGERKLADHGPGFLREISAWLETHERRKFAPSADHLAMPTKPVVNSTAHATLELWRVGKSIDEIAAARGLVSSTIESHLALAIEAGADLDPRHFYSEEEEREMCAALDGYLDPSLKPVFEHLGGRISYGKLKLFRAIEARRTVLQPA
jgi:ATP-dependent DNA helicase RecQ